MRRVRLALKIVVLIVVVAIGGVVGLIGSVTARGLPQIDGTVHIAGLHAAVTIQRDRAGIAQITAGDPHDLFLAQGFFHAQERMWQMEISRRIGAGRLAELFGADLVDTDRYVRTLGWRVAAQRDLDAMAPDVKADLQAYADGVNAWIDAHNGNLSLPFVVAGLKSGAGGFGGLPLEHWTPLDSATWQKVQAWSLGNNVDAEIFRLLADARLGDPNLTDALFPPYDPGAPVITPSGLPGSGGAGATVVTTGSTGGSTGTAGTAGTTASAAGQASGLTAAAAAGWTHLADLGSTIATLAGFDSAGGMLGGHGVGSNDWVASGTRTASGKPILANDPHLGYGMPSVWIMNGLHCRAVSAACPFDVVGVSFPGDPAVILGHNARIAWGATNVGPDTQDLFIETPDPKDPTHYLHKGVSKPYDVRVETIKVAGGQDVQLIVRSTVHGPILNDVDKRLADAQPMALEWTTTKEVDGTLAAFFAIDAAGTFDEFHAAFATYGSPSQNFVYADVDGHIGYVLPGLLPIRSGQSTGERPRVGATGQDDWTGYIRTADLPWQLDPPSGLIVTANNAPVDASYPLWLGRDWDPGYRAARITALVDAKPTGLTAADMRSIQMDPYVLRADRVVPLLAGLRLEPATADGQALLRRILAWDRRCDLDSLGCAAYMTAELDIERGLVDGRLGPLARDYVGTTDSWQALIALLGDPASDWWNDPATAAREDAAHLVAAALDRGGAELRAALGDPSRWTWGRLHTVAFREGTLGSAGIGLLEWYFNAAPRPVAGASGAIDNTYYRERRAYPDPYDPAYVPVGFKGIFDVTNGPSYRLTVDMAHLDAARIVITTGQSGNPFDRHYGDLIADWATGGTVPLPFSTAAISDATVSTLTLSP
jgi:penicillin amidase